MWTSEKTNKQNFLIMQVTPITENFKLDLSTIMSGQNMMFDEAKKFYINHCRSYSINENKLYLTYCLTEENAEWLIKSKQDLNTLIIYNFDKGNNICLKQQMSTVYSHYNMKSTYFNTNNLVIELVYDIVIFTPCSPVKYVAMH